MKNAHRKTRRINRIPPTSSEVALDDEIAAGTPEGATADQEPAAQRLSMPVTSDGRIDVSRLREKSKSALRQALSDPALPVALGITSESNASDSAEDAAILNQITHSLFTGVSALSVAVALRSGVRPEHARALVWDEKELAMVAPLTGKIAKKRLMPLLGDEYRDEILLGYQVLSIIAAKVALMREMAKQPISAEPTNQAAS